MSENLMISDRDPTEKDQILCILWWNRVLNRFFRCIKIEKEKYTWKKLEEREKPTAFTAEFLEKLRDECGALTMIDHYMHDQGMSFHDSILRFANYHSIDPEYVYEGYVGPKIDEKELLKLIDKYVT